MRPFTYARAADAESAVAARSAAGGGAAFLAGGTNLVDLMRLGVATPEHLVDVSRLPQAGIVEHDGGLRIGATARMADVATDPRVRDQFPALAQALLAGASPQLRNVATIGGNLLQRTRCAYWQDVTKPCNKREPGSGCPAIEGEHRSLAILGHSAQCVATHPSDMAVALAALGAQVRALGPGGERLLPMPGLHRLPGTTPQHDTVLREGELLLDVTLPASVAARRSRYRKVRDRASFSFAVVSVAAALELDDDGDVRDVRLALGGVAHAPWRARVAEEVLAGGPPSPERVARAADAELAQARPLRDNAFKVPLARALIVGTLSDLVAEA